MSLRKKLVFLAIVLAFAGAITYMLIPRGKDKSAKAPDEKNPMSSTEKETPTPGFNKNLYKLDEPGSPWWVVNKTRPLPAGYVPGDLAVPDVKLRLGANAEQMQYSQLATPALREMFDAALVDGVTLVFGSGYRSEALQRQFYNQYVAADGQADADRYSARPGTSEHQTGLAFDATNVSEKCHLEICFESTPEGTWLAKNAYKYGFIVRYPNNKESITGYQYEPWHMRYIGIELAAEMHTQNISTLEEFFGLPPAPTYLN